MNEAGGYPDAQSLLSAAPVVSTPVGVFLRPKQAAAPVGARQRSAGSRRQLRAPLAMLSVLAPNLIHRTRQARGGLEP